MLTLASKPEIIGARYIVDVGSTVLKLAVVNSDGQILQQEFHNREYEIEITEHIQRVLAPHAEAIEEEALIVCSSANGGLRVGVVCLSSSYSGALFRNQVLLGGANPLFVQEANSCINESQYVDVLLVGGGVDCQDAGPMEILIRNFEPHRYNYGTLIFAGNRHLAGKFRDKFPDAQLINNPMPQDLTSISDSVFVALRDAYLDDLVYKKGVSELAKRYKCDVWPTPEIVNKGYHRAINDRLLPELSGTSILLDIGGATTDVHYTVEIVRDNSRNRPLRGSAVARYVFTDLGVFISRDSTLIQLRRNSRTFEFLSIILDSDANDIYRLLREGDHDPSPEMLAYACLFIGLDRFSSGNGPGLPTADLTKLEKLVLTGGAAQLLDERKAAEIAGMFLGKPVDDRFVMIDKHYEIWIQGAILHQRQTGARV